MTLCTPHSEVVTFLHNSTIILYCNIEQPKPNSWHIHTYMLTVYKTTDCSISLGTVILCIVFQVLSMYLYRDNEEDENSVRFA